MPMKCLTHLPRANLFCPKVVKSNEKFIGKNFMISINLDKQETVENTAKLFTTAGAKVEVMGTELKIKGDLGKTNCSA